MDYQTNTTLSKGVIIKYNELLSEGYQMMDMNRLGQTAINKMVLKAYHHMAALGEGRTKMISSLKYINFGKITFYENNAKVNIQTKELWDYSYVNLDTNEILSQNSISYDMTYTLFKHNTTWLIADIIIDNTQDKMNHSAASNGISPAGKRHKGQGITTGFTINSKSSSFFQRPLEEPPGSVKKDQ